MSLTEKNIREKEFHNSLQNKKRGRFENVFYKAIYNLGEDFFKYLEKKSNNAEILDYGCGTGLSIEKVAKFNPKKITGIDISDVSIQKAIDKAREGRINVEYKIDNCEKTKFDQNSFDIVYGTGILHHLQIDKCLEEIRRILKPGGTLVFIEPLGTNPIINLYRKFTPKSRSDDEHPLVNKDFDFINSKFIETKIKYYGFLTLIFFPLYRSPKNSKLFKLFSVLDQHLFKSKFFQKFAWSVLITAEKN
ncbi:class I SAM-dependent methyltransferase [Pelagibacteraceae bacterium]|nr:class I SAM-dependent methyltransferase [Pelagibacteraceae bacterium]